MKNWRVIAGCILAVMGVVSWLGSVQPPRPSPDAPSAITLDGLFVGPTAVQDAATVSAMTAEIADEIKWDGEQEKPKMVAAVQFDALRFRVREFRVRGESIGERQPAVRDAVKQFLDRQVGTSGGPVTPEQRAKWVEAYREISKAAENAWK
jgi:hypothetical protein